MGEPSHLPGVLREHHPDVRHVAEAADDAEQVDVAESGWQQQQRCSDGGVQIRCLGVRAKSVEPRFDHTQMWKCQLRSVCPVFEPTSLGSVHAHSERKTHTCLYTQACQSEKPLHSDHARLWRAWAAATRADSGSRCVTGLCSRPAQYSSSHRSRSLQKTPVSTTPYLMCCGQGRVTVRTMTEYTRYAECSGQPGSGDSHGHLGLTWSRHGTMVLKYTPAPSESATALTCNSSRRGYSV